MSAIKCPVCSQSDVEVVRQQLSEQDPTVVYQCSPCDLQFLSTWDDVEYVKSLYEGDKYVFTHNAVKSETVELKYNEYDVRYARVKPYLNKSQSLLEIGCGDGLFLSKIRDDVAVAEGIELSPPQVEKVRSMGLTCYDQMVGELTPPRKYDVICMFAVLEHVPLVVEFLQHLKEFMHEKTHLIIEVPNRKNLLFNTYDVPTFRDFYYRAIHLYYFTPKSLAKLLTDAGFKVTTSTSQQASITNHLHWMHHGKGQPNANYMTAPVLPVGWLDEAGLGDVLDEVDNLYRSRLEEAGIGDLLAAHAVLDSND